MERAKIDAKVAVQRRCVIGFIRYLVSGGMSVVVQFGILVGLIEFFGANASFSSAVGFVLGCITNYLLLYYWAFHARGKHGTVVMRYSFVMGVSLVVNVFVFWNLYVGLQVWYPVSQSVAIALTALINYFLNRNYTFV